MQPQRDGKLRSLWQGTAELYQPKNSWSREHRYDVLVVGAGITGLSTALMLQEKGLKCIIAEARNIGFGSSGGTTAHLNTILDTPYSDIEKDFSGEVARTVRQGCREAIEYIENCVLRHGIDCGFEYKPGFLIAQDAKESEQLETIVAAAQRAGDEAYYAEKLPVSLPVVKVARFEKQAQFHPIKYLYGLAKAYEAAGGVLLQHCVVTELKSGPDFQAVTSLGTIHAEQVIYATHIPPGINVLHFKCAPYRSYAMAFQLKSGQPIPGLIYDLKDPFNYYRSQEIEGKTYVIAGGFDHKTGHEENTEQRFREMESYFRQYFDFGEVAYRWSSQYYQPADGLPYIGHLPGAEKGVWVATGFSGNGMTMGTLAGLILSKLLVGEDHPCWEILYPARIKPIAGFSAFVKENADVVGRFIRDRFSYEQIASLAELAPGQAVLAEWEGRKVAMYKDADGKVHAVNPVCVHAGCMVSWNNAEESWDCPCHGARYSPKGEMLNGPAQGNLQLLIQEQMDGD